jgi:hypothetical protein
MSEKYTCEAGRVITRAGKPFVSLNACKAGEHGPANFAYWEADQFARFIPLAIDAVRLAYEIARQRQGAPYGAIALKCEQALKLLEFKL